MASCEPSDETNPDLFWALRGGGSNVGVVTSLEYRLHPVGPQVMGGMLLHPLERAAEVVAFYRDFVPTAPDALTLYCACWLPTALGGRLGGLL